MNAQAHPSFQAIIVRTLKYYFIVQLHTYPDIVLYLGTITQNCAARMRAALEVTVPPSTMLVLPTALLLEAAAPAGRMLHVCGCHPDSTNSWVHCGIGWQKPAGLIAANE